MKDKIIKSLDRYENIECYRTLSCLGIIAMHMRANSNYQISGFIYNTIVSSWTWGVYLFLIISGFGMCCGYYDKFVNNKIKIDEFYSKRYKKILPFFGFLIILAFIYIYKFINKTAFSYISKLSLYKKC